MNNPLYVCCMDMWDRALVGKKNAFDIGANNGGFSRSLVQKGLNVHAYEPVPDMYDELVKVTWDFPKIIPHRLAVSDNTNPLQCVNVFSAWSILPDGTRWGKAEGYREKKPFDCECTTVDLESKKYGFPDFIKLDVDGYEYRVLKGATETLSRSKCPMLFEYSYLLEWMGDTVMDLTNLIYGLGYQAWSMDGNYCCTDAAQMRSCYPDNTSFDCMLIHKDNPV